MDIALVTHSHHQTTESNRFFIAALEQIGTVTVFWDESWMWKDASFLTSFRPSAFDLIVIWQWSKLLVAMPSALLQHHNVVVVPMHDMVAATPTWIWPRVARRFKLVCFSSGLFGQFAAQTPAIHRVKYYPDPAILPPNISSGELSGFFWQRSNQITESNLSALCNGTKFSLFTVHQALDPGNVIPIEPHVQSTISTDILKRSSWHSSRGDYLRDVSKHQIFFAPRLHEGIGLAFLEAMAMGLCVVAPNTPTHNEYIVSNENGLLYDTFNHPLRFDHAPQMGQKAYSSIKEGHERWLASVDGMLHFIAKPLSF